jgi:hypothetical protein
MQRSWSLATSGGYDRFAQSWEAQAPTVWPHGYAGAITTLADYFARIGAWYVIRLSEDA